MPTNKEENPSYCPFTVVIAINKAKGKQRTRSAKRQVTRVLKKKLILNKDVQAI